MTESIKKLKMAVWLNVMTESIKKLKMAVWLNAMLHAAYFFWSTFSLHMDMMARMKAGMAQTKSRQQPARVIMEHTRAYIDNPGM